MRTKKISLVLKSFNIKHLNQACCIFFQELSKLPEIHVVGPISLPITKRIYCVLRSPHKYKNSREHFEIRISKQLINIYYNSSVKLYKTLQTIALPSGIFCNVI